MKRYTLLLVALLLCITTIEAKAKPKREATPKQTSIYVGSYNLWAARARDWKITRQGAGPEARLWENAAHIVAQSIADNGFDICGTQECDFRVRELLPELLKKTKGGKNYKIWWGLADPENPENSSANGVIYRADRFKILGGRVVWLSETPDIKSTGWDEKRHIRTASFLKVLDKRSKQPFYFIVTHIPLKPKAKEMSAGVIIEHEKKFNTEGLISILVGDMNARQEMSYSAHIREHFDDAYLIADKRCGTQGTFTGSAQNEANFTRPDRRIDYIYIHADDKSRYKVHSYEVIRKKYKHKDGNEYFPSDHCAIGANIIIK